MTATGDALDAFLEDRRKLPQTCPDWCREPHAQALEEGATVEEASRHFGPEFCVFADPKARKQWVTTRLISDHEKTGWWGVPTIVVSVAGGEIALDTGQARILARQLLHLADVADLHA